MDHGLYKAALAADDAWQDALTREYGKQAAGTARYDRRGRATRELDALYLAKVAADRAVTETRVTQTRDNDPRFRVGVILRH